MKLIIELPTNEIRTAVVEQTGDKDRSLKTVTTTIDEFVKYFHLHTNLKCMTAPVKLWIHQNSTTEATYGPTFKDNPHIPAPLITHPTALL